MTPRRGSLMIIVAGICAILATLATSFLVRMRSDAAEGNRILQDAQARAMLTGACAFLLESAPAAPDAPAAGHRGDLVTGNGFFQVLGARPGGGRLVGRFPMHVMNLPPHAVQSTRVYQPDLGPLHWDDRAPASASAPLDAYRANWEEQGERRPTVWRPDPTRYATAAGSLKTASGTSPAPASAVDRTPTADSQNRAWFRIWWAAYGEAVDAPYRAAAGAVWSATAPTRTKSATARFIITCGAGASQGYRDWAEVVAAGDQAVFYNDPGHFADLVANESRLWYEVCWRSVDISVLDSAGKLIIPPDPGPSKEKLGATAEDVAAYYAPLDPAKDCLAYSLSLTTDAFRWFGEIERIRRLTVPPANY